MRHKEGEMMGEGGRASAERTRGQDGDSAEGQMRQTAWATSERRHGMRERDGKESGR